MMRGYTICILIALSFIAVVFGKDQSEPNFTYNEVRAGLKLGKEASARFADILKNPSLSADKRAILKEAIEFESKAASYGKKCCVESPKKLSKSCSYYEYKTSYKCGFGWWFDCYKISSRTSCGRKRRDISIKAAPTDLSKCPRGDQVCCPGTVWYDHIGKCLDIKKICDKCDCCA